MKTYLLLFVAAALCLTSCGPNAEFDTTETSFLVGDTIEFINLSRNADSYIWDFGDGQSSDLVDPEYIYLYPGEYIVTLEASNDQGTDEYSISLDIQENEMIKMIKAHLDHFQDSKMFPGMSLAVYDNSNDVILTATAGYSDFSIPIDESMLFAGPTMSILGAICLRMAEDKLLSIEDTIGTYLGPMTNVTPGITIRQLLFHMSGLNLKTDALTQALRNDRNRIWTLDEVATYIEKVGSPGDGPLYSFASFTLLAMVLEEASGKSISELIDSIIKEPLNLNDLYLAAFDEYDESMLAVPYNGTSTIHIAELSALYPYQGTVSTASDLVSFTHAIFETDFLSSGSKEILKERIPSKDFPEEWHVGGGMAYNNMFQMYEMEGINISGYFGIACYDPENHASVAILVNDQDMKFKDWDLNALARDILDLF